MERKLRNRLTILILVLQIFGIVIASGISLVVAMLLDEAKQHYTVVSYEEPDMMDDSIFRFSVETDVSGLIYYKRIPKENRMIMKVLSVTQLIQPFVLVGIGIFAADFFFYKKYLIKSLQALKIGMEHIKNQDLDFEMLYQAQNELGEVCESFNVMRVALKNSYEELSQQQREKAFVMKAVAHDLRTPLTVLSGYLEQADKSEEIQIMERNVMRMTKYIDDIQNMMKLEDWTLRNSKIDAKLLKKEIESYGYLDSRKEYIVECMIQGVLDIDSNLVLRVTENILANAFEYAKTTVSIKITEDEAAVKFTIMNDGESFTQEIMEHSTDPFFRGDKSRKGSHMGLGMSIANILTQIHGGNVKCINYQGMACVKLQFKKIF